MSHRVIVSAVNRWGRDPSNQATGSGAAERRLAWKRAINRGRAVCARGCGTTTSSPSPTTRCARTRARRPDGGRRAHLPRRRLSPWGSTSRSGTASPSTTTPACADVVTLTAGGNDLLGGVLPRAILRRLHQIGERIQPLGARVVINTIYDSSDGNNDVGRRELGLSWLATIELRRRLNAVNRGIAQLAAERSFLLADLERLFHGHGLASNEPWFVQVIEPNLAGATATAEHWYDLLTSR